MERLPSTEAEFVSAICLICQELRRMNGFETKARQQGAETIAGQYARQAQVLRNERTMLQALMYSHGYGHV